MRLCPSLLKLNPANVMSLTLFSSPPIMRSCTWPFAASGTLSPCLTFYIVKQAYYPAGNIICLVIEPLCIFPVAGVQRLQSFLCYGMYLYVRPLYGFVRRQCAARLHALIVVPLAKPAGAVVRQLVRLQSHASCHARMYLAHKHPMICFGKVQDQEMAPLRLEVRSRAAEVLHNLSQAANLVHHVVGHLFEVSGVA